MPAIVMVMSLSTGIVVLCHSGHDPSWLLAEVYDQACWGQKGRGKTEPDTLTVWARSSI